MTAALRIPAGIPPEVFAAYQNAPAHVVAEVIDGELHTMTRPARRHARASMELGADLVFGYGRGRGGPGGWVILGGPELWLGSRPDILVPDIAGWRRERLPDLFGDDDAPPYFELTPDWVCETLSPSTERLDRVKKMHIYRREGVRHVWLVHPGLQTLEAYRFDDGRFTLVDTFEGDAKLRVEPFDAVEIDLALLWAR